jgi:hypothetical protein
VFTDFMLRNSRTKLIGYGLLILAVIELFAHSYICAENFGIDSSEYSTQLQAGSWINSNIKPGSRIGLCSLPGPYFVPPMDFRKYRISVRLNNAGFKNLDYFICGTYAQKKPPDAVLQLEKDFKPYSSFLGMRYSMGSTSLNSEVMIYKIKKIPEPSGPTNKNIN